MSVIRSIIKHELFWPTVVVSIAACLLFGPVFRGDMPLPARSIPGITWGQPEAAAQTSIFRDRIVQAYPYHLFAAQEIQAGRLPLWNDLIFAGTPFFANGQAGIFSFLKLPWWWLPPWLSYNITTLLQSVLAGFGVALLGRKLGWKPAASAIAGLVLTLSASFVMRMTVTTMSAVFAWLPIVLWSLLRLHDELSWRRVGQSALLMAMMVFAGHVQLAAFALVFAGLWALTFWRRTNVGRRLMAVAAAFFLGVALTAVQMVPVKEALGQAYRQPNTMSWSKALNPKHLFHIDKKSGAALLTMFDQNIWGKEAHYRGPANYLEGNLYIGVVAMLFAITSLIAWRQRGWRLSAAMAVFVAGLYIFPGWWDLVGKIAPWITVTPVWRTSFLFAFSVALLCGFGAQAVLSRRTNWISWTAVGLVAVTALWQWWGILPFTPKSQLFPPNALLTAAKNLTADGSRLWTPNGVLDQYMPYGIPTVEGYDSVYPGSYLELFQANSEIRKRNQLHVRYPNDQVLAAAGGNIMITSDPVLGGWTTVTKSGIWTLAKRNEAIAPIHAVDRLAADSTTPILTGLDMAHEALIAGDSPATNQINETTITVTDRHPTRVVMQTTSKNDAAIVTNFQYYPGWHVFIDQHEASAAMIRVNHSFIGLAVPGGMHTVMLRYQPRSFLYGLIISIGALAVILIMIGVGWKPKNKPRDRVAG